MSDLDKDMEILVFQHQLNALQWQLDPARPAHQCRSGVSGRFAPIECWRPATRLLLAVSAGN